MLRPALTRFLALAALATTAVAPGPASAQSTYAYEHNRQRGTHPELNYGGSTDYEAQSRGCIRECSHDMSPCDPLIFKRADGRCNYEN